MQLKRLWLQAALLVRGWPAVSPKTRVAVRHMKCIHFYEPMGVNQMPEECQADVGTKGAAGQWPGSSMR